jgi:two-component system sensor histidine kinase TctE
VSESENKPSTEEKAGEKVEGKAADMAAGLTGGIFKREQRSLFGEILDWMLTPLLLLWPASLALTWLVAQNIADKPFDRALEYNVQALAQLVVVKNGQAQFNLPQPARELLRADDVDQIYYQVIGFRGEVISGEKDVPSPPEAIRHSAWEVKLRDEEVRGLPVRVASIWIQSDVPGDRDALVQVAETREKRSVLATEIIKGVMLPQFVILPLAVLLVWLALVRGTRPLNQLEARIRARKSDDLSPLDESSVPQEVVPLVSSVNGLLTRLKDSMATQKRFLADAAHQLKTPLAGLRMQADLALRQGASAEDLKLSLHQIGRSSIRATHTVNQLLALARAEGGGHVLTLQLCDLAALARDVVQDAIPKAMEKRLDLGYEGELADASNAMVMANPTLIKELIRNLVDNALNYTPSSGQNIGVVTVRIITDRVQKSVRLEVEDTGPGIPEAERELVMQPFYRVLGSNTDGSGLGLAIVQEIAQKHAAQLTIEDAHPDVAQTGARFTLQFQLAV